jgi:orotidine-5'-phosphate decarboxylase
MTSVAKSTSNLNRPNEEGFLSRLNAFYSTNRSELIVGLDPVVDWLPTGISRTADGVVEFNRRIIAATRDLVMGYKPNLAFYEALGAEGWRALERTRHLIPSELIAFADAKRGDIADTSELYAQSILDNLDFDAVTVNPYVGREGLAPFVQRSSKGIFIVCRTSERSQSIQNLDNCGVPLYMSVALEAIEWGPNVGLVVGATDIDALRAVREISPSVPLLTPGVGAQGGRIEEAARAARAGGGRVLMPISRAILYASDGPDFDVAARSACLGFKSQLEQAATAT